MIVPRTGQATEGDGLPHGLSPGKQPGYQRQHGADQQTSHDRKIEAAAPPFNVDIAWQAADANSQPFTEHDYQAHDYKQDSGINQESAHVIPEYCC